MGTIDREAHASEDFFRVTRSEDAAAPDVLQFLPRFFEKSTFMRLDVFPRTLREPFDRRSESDCFRDRLGATFELRGRIGYRKTILVDVSDHHAAPEKGREALEERSLAVENADAGRSVQFMA